MEETVVAHAVEKSVGSHIYSSIVTVILAITVVVLVNIISKSNTSKGSSEANEKNTSTRTLQYKDLFYICIILGICIVVIFSFVFYDNQDAINLFSFASTLASIILSIVAIFISISGERTQELHRSQIAETAKKLENTRVKLENNIENLNDKLDQIEAKIEKAVKNTDKLINYKYIKSEDLATENESYEESLFEDEKS